MGGGHRRRCGSWEDWTTPRSLSVTQTEQYLCVLIRVLALLQQIVQILTSCHHRFPKARESMQKRPSRHVNVDLVQHVCDIVMSPPSDDIATRPDGVGEGPARSCSGSIGCILDRFSPAHPIPTGQGLNCRCASLPSSRQMADDAGLPGLLREWL